MLKHIEYNLEFSNGQKRNLSTDLQHGSTMITGRNGRGKSLLLEMFSFALFGAKALRGVASDYKKIDVHVRVAIRGKDYEIKRTKTKASIGLLGEAEPLATTTTPVNQFIEQLLGYNYDVFRVSNWCAQGDIQALANMKPTERKAMIDNVAGLTQLDGLINIVKGDIKTFKTSIAAVEDAVTKPLEPMMPLIKEEAHLEKKAAAEAVQKKARDLSNGLSEYKFLQAPVEPREPVYRAKPTTPPTAAVLPEKPEPKQLAPFTLTEPVRPTCLGTMSYDEMVKVCRSIWDDLTLRQANVKAAENDLKRCMPIPQELRGEVIATSIEHWEAQAEAWRQKRSYDALLKQGDVTCPNCQHRHPVASDVLAKYDVSSFPESEPLNPAMYNNYMETIKAEDRLATRKSELEGKFGDAQAQATSFARLDEIKAELQEWKRACQEYETAHSRYQLELSNLDQLNAQQLNHWKQQCQMVEQQNAQQLRAYEAVCHDIDKENAQAQANLANQKEIFAKAHADYLENALHRDQLATDLLAVQNSQEFKDAEGVIQDCLEQLGQWKTYRALYQQYKQQLDSYDQAMARIQNEKDQLEDLGKAHTALVELKARVKTYIIPSLNKVASYLLSEMTGGEHNSITIDDDFEVYVDATPLRVMSGSGKDIANLSIRIALGRILTHKVLGMVMLDEIDQGMDESRAAYTWECIEKITPQIGQVLQVSHKELRAENRLVIQ